MSLVETDWLEKKISKVKIIECSWHMPSQNRNSFKEYTNSHIPNAIFFDLDKNSNDNTDLPHMLPQKKKWENIVSSMGISNNDEIIIYDNSDLISSCRCWYTFYYFGHDPKNIKVLNGGFKKWKLENKVTTNIVTKINKSKYKASEFKDLVVNKDEVNNNINEQKFKLIDARSKVRFNGQEKEPRSNLKSGSIPKSLCLPFKDLINTQNNTFKDKKELKKIFSDILSIDNSPKIVFSCGSGVTASVLALAYSLIDNKYRPTIYDGSWSEYGRI